MFIFHIYIKVNFSAYNFKFRNRSAFAITETELKLIAKAAIIGESKDRKGYKPLPQSGFRVHYKRKQKIN
jgi:hypothetical protein